MRRACLVLLALFFAPAAAGCASAQTQGPAPAVSDAPPPAQAPQRRRPRVYTGLDLAFSASVGSDMAVSPAHPVVRGVEPGSPAQLAGIVAGDVITEVDGRDSREEGALWLRPGIRHTLRVRSGDQEREVLLTPLPPRTPPPAPAP
jgi:S1-C subfamily serine protease